MNELQHLPKSELLHGAYYAGSCRNGFVARWDANTELFYYWRRKFEYVFIDEIKCPEDDQVYDVFYAATKLGDDQDYPIPTPSFPRSDER